MANETDPYINRNPGDLVTSEDWNDVQVRIKEDIESRIQSAIAAIESVNKAGDAEKLGGKTTEELTDEILERALAEVPERTGYLKIFKVLTVGERARHPLHVLGIHRVVFRADHERRHGDVSEFVCPVPLNQLAAGT